jgi:chromosomal replication initiation ATPase DnaA
MKAKIFNNYVEKICELFSIDEDTLFTKSKRRDIVDARHLLYYACYIRPMRLVYIQEYMAEKGYLINHSSIIHGIDMVTKKIKKDKDYVNVVKEIQQCIIA